MTLAPMADMTMCADIACPRRNECHRFTATAQPHGWQKWYMSTPRDAKTGECKEFWPNSQTQRNEN